MSPGPPDQCGELSPVEVTYSAGDLFALNILVWRKWITLLACLFVVVVGLHVGTALLEGLKFGQAVRSMDVLTLLMGPVILFLIIVITPFQIIRARKKNGWNIPLQFSFTADRIVIDHAQGKTELVWSAIKRIRLARSRVFLFTTPACAYILPCRLFESENEFKAFAERIEQYWDATKRIV